MNITSEQLEKIKSAFITAQIGGIENLIIDSGLIRGVNDDKSFALISDNVPVLPQKIGISRLSTLIKRMNLFSGEISVEGKETERGEISMLEFVSGRNKMQFRCTSSLLIKAPKSINDESSFGLNIKENEISLITNSIRAMSNKKILLIVNNNRVRFEIKDESNDVFKIELENDIISDDNKDSILFTYTSDIIVSVLSKLEKDSTIFVGEMGTIKTFINGHEITILPVINEE